MEALGKDKVQMLQNTFMFTTEDNEGYSNEGIRRITYGPDYTISISR